MLSAKYKVPINNKDLSSLYPFRPILREWFIAKAIIKDYFWSPLTYGGEMWDSLGNHYIKLPLQEYRSF